MVLDQIAEQKREERQLRLAMVSRDSINPASLFSELKVVSDDEDEVAESTDDEGNPISVVYDFSNAEFDPKKVEEEIQQMLARAAQGEATFEHKNYEGWI